MVIEQSWERHDDKVWKCCQIGRGRLSPPHYRAGIGGGAGEEANGGANIEAARCPQQAAPPDLAVNTNDPAMMNLALNNATNVEQYYKDLGENVMIEVVTYGPGLHMLRDDTSPVKARIKAIAESTPAISFKACGNTQENMHKVENKEIPLIPEAKVVKSGVVRVMELQERGWTYVKP
jgi:intracellular sulfur oxidation DsrE/DsrF family protein